MATPGNQIHLQENATFPPPRWCRLCQQRAPPDSNPALDSLGINILHYIFPIILFMGILLGIINLVVFSRTIRTSRESYFLSFVISCNVVLITGGVLKLPKYFTMPTSYQHANSYLCSVQNWFWYAALWILLVAGLERTVHVSQWRPKSHSNPTKAFIITILVLCVSFVSALPQFWQFDQLDVPVHNTTNSKYKMIEEYTIIYFWYTVSITLFLPYPLLFLITFLLFRGVQRSSQSRRRHSVQHGTGQILNRRMSAEMNINRLFITLILLLIMLTGPNTVLSVVDYAFLGRMWSSFKTRAMLHETFLLLFYLFHTLHLLVFFKYNQAFRSTFMLMFCCCLKKKCHKELQKTYSFHDKS